MCGGVCDCVCGCVRLCVWVQAFMGVGVRVCEREREMISQQVKEFLKKYFAFDIY